MANTPTPNFEIPTEMRDFAEKSVEQARRAIDGFMGAAQRTVDTMETSATTVQSSTRDATRKTFAYAEQNIAAAFDLAQRMVRARDMQEAVQIQADFVRQQFNVMQTQMKDFGSMAQSAMGQAGVGQGGMGQGGMGQGSPSTGNAGASTGGASPAKK